MPATPCLPVYQRPLSAAKQDGCSLRAAFSVVAGVVCTFSDTIFTEWSHLPTLHLTTVCRLPTLHLTTVCRLPTLHLTTVCRLPTLHLTTVCRLPARKLSPIPALPCRLQQSVQLSLISSLVDVRLGGYYFSMTNVCVCAEPWRHHMHAFLLE